MFRAYLSYEKFWAGAYYVSLKIHKSDNLNNIFNEISKYITLCMHIVTVALFNYKLIYKNKIISQVECNCTVI